MRGQHTLFMGDRLEIWTRRGYVYFFLVSPTYEEQAIATPDQARAIAADLIAYASQADDERKPLDQKNS